MRARSDDIRAVILSPTRELAEQIGVEARNLCAGTGVIVQTAVGGTQRNQMLRKTQREGCHLLVATPGRLADILSDATTGIDCPNLSALVLDEADRMLDVGFERELNEILSFLPNRAEVPRQTLLYSATMPKNVVGLARKFVDPTNFEFVQTIRSDEAPTHERVPQFIVPCRGFENLAPTLLELIRRDVRKTLEDSSQRPFKAIVFLPTTASVVAYSSIFRRIKYNDSLIPTVLDIHSKLTQNERTRNASQFKNMESGILFSSDVTARGMDFPNVTHVIQVHLPNDRDHYIHRIGRTGRAGKEGQAYLLVSDAEVQGARERLPGLPIQRVKDFESATFQVTNLEDLPQTFAEVLEASKKQPYDVLQSMYAAFLGGASRGMDKETLVNEINRMAMYSWGMEEPPAVSPTAAAHYKPGLLRIAERRRRSGFGDRGGFDDRGGFGDRAHRNSRGPRRDRDSFSVLERSSEQRGRSRRAPSATF
jgi:ATP-dependent RNA helicase MSS116